MGMFSDICGFFKAVFTDLGNLFDVYPKKKGPSIHKPNDESSPWGADSYEPWDFLSDEQWEEIFRGDKSLEDFTMSHVWPPEKHEDNNIVEVEQENAQEQEGSENAESEENLEGSDELSELDSTPESDSMVFESNGSSESGFDSDSDGSGTSGDYDGYIG